MPSGKFIILKCKRFAESDLIVDVIGHDGEKKTLSAKNALKSRRRFAGGVLEPMNFVELQYTQAKSGRLFIQEGQIVYGFPRLREDYQKIQVAVHLLQLISKGAQEGMADNHILFDILGNALRALEGTDQPQVLKLHFEIKFLYYLGFIDVAEEFKELIARPISKHQGLDMSDIEFQRIGNFSKQHLNQLNG